MLGKNFLGYVLFILNKAAHTCRRQIECGYFSLDIVCWAREFFLSGKTLPIERGQGLQQPAMRTAAKLLGRGDWVHVFPEGRVGYSGRLQPCKWGVGKLVCDCVAETGK